MNIRTAILKAANVIVQNPRLYDFSGPRVPPCGSPGCLLGLIGFQFGLVVGTINARVCDEVFGFSDTSVFYDRMMDLDVEDWMDNPESAVVALRLYADKYHPAQAIPDSILKIFNQTPDHADA